jgi:hypothetical protein
MSTPAQPPNTFQISKKRPTGLLPYEYRPTLSATQQALNSSAAASKSDQGITEAAYRELQDGFRQIYDFFYQLRDNGGPSSLFTKGELTGATQAVLAQTSAGDLGSSLGLQLTLARPGTWTISTAVCLSIEGDTDLFTLSLVVGQTPLPYTALRQAGADEIVMLAQNWSVAVQGGEILTLWIKKAAGAGTSNVIPGNTTMTAEWMGPA